MLKSEDIINGLQSIVDDNSAFAVIWHCVFYILIAALALKWTPSNKLSGLLTCLPLISVAIFGWLTGNPFNGTVFSIATILMFIFGLKASGQPINYSQFPFIIAGILMITFGLVYPHFIKPDSIIKYLYASPAGLIPCPTLSVLIGFLLLYNGFGSQPITLTLILLGLFYGIFGVLKLRVYLDLFLLFGTLTLLVKYLLSIRTPAILN
jgi:hypothetical protein